MLGSQWGDEGKGKLVDILAQQYDVVARAQACRSPHVIGCRAGSCFSASAWVVLTYGGWPVC